MMTRIVVADHDPDRLAVVRDRLDPTRYDVRSTIVGEQALDMLYQDPPDVLIISSELPWLDQHLAAPLLVQAVASHPRWRACLVILVTPPDSPSWLIASSRVLALKEPVPLDTLRRLIEEFCTKKSA